MVIGSVELVGLFPMAVVPGALSAGDAALHGQDPIEASSVGVMFGAAGGPLALEKGVFVSGARALIGGGVTGLSGWGAYESFSEGNYAGGTYRLFMFGLSAYGTAGEAGQFAGDTRPFLAQNARALAATIRLQSPIVVRMGTPGTAFSMGGLGDVRISLRSPLSLAEVRSLLGSGPETGALNLRSTAGGELRVPTKHHLTTLENVVSEAGGGPYTPLFERLLARGGLRITDPRLAIEVPGHAGPHAAANWYTYMKLQEAIRGLTGESATRQAILQRVRALRIEALTPGETLNTLIQAP
jgi:hypothetical protein